MSFFIRHFLLSKKTIKLLWFDGLDLFVLGLDQIAFCSPRALQALSPETENDSAANIEAEFPVMDFASKNHSTKGAMPRSILSGRDCIQPWIFMGFSKTPPAPIEQQHSVTKEEKCFALSLQSVIFLEKN